MLANDLIIEYTAGGTGRSRASLRFPRGAADAVFTKLWRRLGDGYALRPFRLDPWTAAKAPLIAAVTVIVVAALFALGLNALSDGVPPEQPAGPFGFRAAAGRRVRRGRGGGRNRWAHSPADAAAGTAGTGPGVGRSSRHTPQPAAGSPAHASTARRLAAATGNTGPRQPGDAAADTATTADPAATVAPSPAPGGHRGRDRPPATRNTRTP